MWLKGIGGIISIFEKSGGEKSKYRVYKFSFRI
jgi:hypothetical protein